MRPCTCQVSQTIASGEARQLLEHQRDSRLVLPLVLRRRRQPRHRHGKFQELTSQNARLTGIGPEIRRKLPTVQLKCGLAVHPWFLAHEPRH
jgi:hypothetical protein